MAWPLRSAGRSPRAALSLMVTTATVIGRPAAAPGGGPCGAPVVGACSWAWWCSPPSCSVAILALPAILTALAAALVHQPHRLDRHATVHCLAHVVDRQRGHGHGGERLHLHAGLGDCARGSLDLQRRGRL